MKLKLMATPRYLPNFLEEMEAKIQEAKDNDQDIECICINRDEAYTMMVTMKKQKTWMKGETLQSIENGRVELKFRGVDVRIG